MFQFKSGFFHIEIFFFESRIFISSRDFYLMSTVFSYRHFSFKEEKFFLSQVEIFVLFEVFQVDISEFKARCYPGVLVDISWQ